MAGRGVLWLTALATVGCLDGPRHRQVDGVDPLASPPVVRLDASAPTDAGPPVDQDAAEPDVAAPPDAALPPDAARLRDAAPPADAAVVRAGPFERCGRQIECATLRVPLNHADPEGRHIDYFVRRVRALRQPARGQLWMIQGGPGAPGDAMLDLAGPLRIRLPDLDIYVPDHRGTGRSDWLGCPGGDEAECVAALRQQWGDDLRFFSTTQAARDLGAAVAAFGEPDEAVYVWAVSYGTYLANRYLHLFPAQADAVVLDSACSGDTCPMTTWDRNFDRVGRAYLAGCAADAECAARLGPEPVAALADLYGRLAAGHCPDLQGDAHLDAAGLRTLLANLVRLDLLRPLMAPVVHRLLRCRPDDVQAVVGLARVLADGLERPAEPGGSSDAVYLNIVASEFLDDPVDGDALWAFAEAALVADYGSPQVWEAAQGFPFPRYPTEPDWRRWADTDRPLLLLNGTLDPQTPHFLLDDAVDHFTGPAQHVVFVPGAPHGVIQYATEADRGPPCGFELTVAFLTDPSAPLDRGCADSLPPPSYAVAPELAAGAFGAPDAWGDGQKASWPRADLARARAALTERVREAARRLPAGPRF